MQCVVRGIGTPVAAVKYGIADVEDRCRCWLPVLLRQHDKDIVRQIPGYLDKEIVAEVGHRTPSQECQAD